MKSNYERDPLGWLDDAARDGRGARWISRRALCVYDAQVARALLRNDGGRMAEHSDFFGNGPHAPAREVQIAIARQTLALVHEHAQNMDSQRFVSAVGERSEWPRAGNALLLDIMRPVLAAPWRSRAFHETVNNMIDTRIFGRHEPALGTIRRIRNRFRFYQAVVGEAAGAEENPTGKPDLLEVIRSHWPTIDEKALVHLFAGFIFATVGSIGFALGWALLQAIRQKKADHLAAHNVLEALRLYPVAWLFERRVRQPDVILGERILPKQGVIISPYAVHRNPVYWNEPTRFLPERWSAIADRSAWLPFGAGEHGCVAAGLSVGLASRLLSEILSREPQIELGDGPPSLGAALAPPRFILKMRAAG
jgi:cytochrome P450